MEVDPYSFVSALNGVLAQRLVRLNCPNCLAPGAGKLDEFSSVTLSESGIPPEQLKHGRGCGHCRGTGYKGRKAICEILSMNDELRELIVAREPIRKIKEAAYRGGTRSLREAAMGLARAGETTIQEVDRVTVAA